MEDNIRFIEPVCENYDRFVKILIAIGKKTVPRGYRKEYIPCWTEESDRSYEQLLEDDSPATAKELLKSLDEARWTNWSQTVESLDFSTSSRKAWSLLRCLGGASKSLTGLFKIYPDLVARRIVASSKVASDKPFKRDILKKYRRLRRRARVDTELTQPFTAEEVAQALTQLKKGKAAGDDCVYSEFLVLGGKSVCSWLAKLLPT